MSRPRERLHLCLPRRLGLLGADSGVAQQSDCRVRPRGLGATDRERDGVQADPQIGSGDVQRHDLPGRGVRQATPRVGQVLCRSDRSPSPRLSRPVGRRGGSEHPDHDSAVVEVIRKTGKVVQAHEWGVGLLPRDVRINRSKISIEVKHPIGPRGADGEIDFSFIGRPHVVKTTGCVLKHEVANGTIKGTVQIKVHDRFFKTITLTRMRARASDSQFGQGCPPEPCPHRQYSLSGTTSHAPNSPAVTLGAGKPPNMLAPLAVDVSEPTAGTPFTVIDHTLTLGGRRSFLSVKPSLTGATLGAPGGVFSGGLGVRSSGPATTFLEPCKGGHFQVTNRPAVVTRGKITATFDSIGKVSVGKNLNRWLDLQSWRRVP
jgi:hypothetical protein